MANENKDIVDVVKKCKILLLDVSGTTTSISFAKTDLLSYAEKNVKEFLEKHWESDDVKLAVTALRKQAAEDKEASVEGAVEVPEEDASKEDQIEGLVKSVQWQISTDCDVAPLKELQGLIWQQGYDSDELKGHVFDDVQPALKQWRTTEGQKVYIYSSGSVLSQKLLFGKSTDGDLLPLIDGHFDIAVGEKSDSASYKTIAEKIGCKPEEILYINDMPKEAEAARTAGLQTALISREDKDPLSAEPEPDHPVIHSLAALTVSNKRKQETQDELPAKVPKTDKVSEIEAVADDVTKVKVSQQPELMEVEEISSSGDDSKTENKDEATVTIEEITGSNEANESPVLDIEPVIEDKVEEKEAKTDDKQTEKMEADNGITEITEVKNGDVDIPASCDVKTPPSATEIEEITVKHLDHATNGVEDLQPVIQEPTDAEDMELKNVGQVLEKECDEILSKVQENLQNLPIRILNLPSEETLQGINRDDASIFEKGMDLDIDDMKQIDDIDLNIVVEINDGPQAKFSLQDDSSCDNDMEVAETDNAENNVETKNITEQTVVESSPSETAEEVKAENAKMEEVIVGTSKIEEDNVKETKMEESKEEESKKEESEVEKSNVEECKMEESKVEKSIVDKSKVEESKVVESKVVESKVVESKVVESKVDESKMEESIVEESKVEESKVENSKVGDSNVESAKVEVVQKVETEKTPADVTLVIETDAKVESKQKDVAEKVDSIKSIADKIQSVVDDKGATTPEMKPVSDKTSLAKDISENGKGLQMNGKATNGDAETVNVNGNTSKEEELRSRLSVENGEEVNGSVDGEQGQGDNKGDPEVADIKVKTITVDEPCTDPIEQPTEA